MPRALSATGERHRFLEEGGWRIYSPRHAPEASLEGHLTFALKYEGLDLAVLKRLFAATGPSPVAALVRAKPTGSCARRSWFLYEWLTGTRLDLPDADRGVYALIVDPDLQFAARAETSSRYRVKNNLPGTPAFCPMVHRTETLNRFIATDLCSHAQDAAAAVPSEMLSRTAAFLLLKESRASFAIEVEHPPPDRIQRWGRALGQAGQRPIDLDEFLRLQSIVIGDARFVSLGLRREGGFVGVHDLESGMPIPDHLGARQEDLAGLVDGMTAFDRQAQRNISTRLSLPPFSPSASSMYILSRTATVGCTATWFTTRWLAAALVRPILSFRYLRRSWTKSTTTGLRSKPIRSECCRSSTGSRRRKAMFGC